MASLSYTEWCDHHHFPYDNDPDRRAAWKQFCENEERRPQPTPTRGLDGTITRTWIQDRQAELNRRSYRVFYRLIFPPPIPILSVTPLANNPWLGWHGID
jgi:hypothetical protein